MRRGEWRGSGRGASSVRSAGSECWSVSGGDRAPGGPEMRDGWWESDECQYCDGHWAPLVCISLRLSPGPNQLQLVCCPAAAGAHSTLVTGQTRISGPERERERERWAPGLRLTLRWLEHLTTEPEPGRGERERIEKKALSRSFFARVISNFLFCCCLKTSLPPFFRLSQHQHRTLNREKRQEEGLQNFIG